MHENDKISKASKLKVLYMHTASKKSIIVSWLVKMEYIVCAHIIAFKTFDRERT